MLVVVELAAAMGNRQHQEKCKDRLSDLSEQDSQQSTSRGAFFMGKRMQTQIRFLVGGANSAFGGFSAGDILRCSTAFAKHLVEEVKCAKYMDAPKVEAVEVVKDEPVKRGRKAK